MRGLRSERNYSESASTTALAQSHWDWQRFLDEILRKHSRDVGLRNPGVLHSGVAAVYSPDWIVHCAIHHHL